LVRAFLDAAIDDLVRSNLSALNGSLQSRMGLLSNLPLPPSPSDDAKPLAVRVEERTNFALLRARSQDGAEHAEGSDANASSRQDGASGLHESDRMESPQRSTRASQARRQPESEARRGDESSADELDTRARRGPIILSEKRLSELGRWEFRWVNGLLSPRRQASVDLHPDDPDLLKSFDDWLAWVMGQSMGPAKAVDCKTGFWLEMPEESAGDESFWYLRYVLLAADDASLSVTAAQVFVTGSSRLRVLDHSFDRPQEKLLADLGRAGRIFEPIRQSLESPRPEGVFLDSKQAWRFISEAGPVLYASGFDVRLPEELTGQGQRRLRARLRIRDMDGPESHFKINDLAAFHWEAALGDEAISAEEFRQLAELKQPLVRWRGKWVLVDPLQMRSIQDLLGNANACGTMSRFEALSRALTGLADPNAPNSNIEVVVEGRIAELAAQLANADVGEESAIAVPSAFQGELRAYQERGLSWLAYQSRLGLGCCLADDMGLGKTIQLIAELLHHAEILPDDRRGTLLVCPTSVVGNWQRELQRFAPELPVIRHHGNERASSIEELEARMAKPHTVVITTYGLATRDVELLKQRPWARFVLDEAQAIKNVTAKRSQAVREIDAAFRVALTGTPIENRLSELWAILDFLNPSLLGHFEKFRRSYALPIERYHDAVALERLRRLVGPFIMRRVKTDPGVIKDLPEKMEMKVYCTLTREQATLYQALVDAAMNNIDDAQGIARHGRILALLTRLKQVVDHPHLVQNDKAFEPRRSGKLTRLLEMLEELSDMGERALIFTQFKQMGDILVSVLQERFDVDVPFLHGGVPQQQRDELVERFQDDDGPPFFVLSLRAGGTGLNLTAATHVFHYDRWWNPAVEDQATDRAFRIGQTKNVQVHKMLSIGTLEEKIDSMLTEKRNLADTIVDSTGAWVTELDTDAIRDLVSLSSDATIDDVD
jgi:SNF2 family DNA or RNA helicase